MKKKVVAFLPVKGSSSRVESKNMKLLDGKPLFLYTLEKLLGCEFIDEIYLDTESEEIVELAKYLDARILWRDKNLANNSTNGNQLLLNAINQVDADIYIQYLCTSPFIEKGTIKSALDSVLEHGYDSAFLTNKAKQYTWTNDKSDYDLNNIPNSIDLPDTTIETMGLYVITREAAISTQRRIGENPFLINASAIEAVDVNYPDDFELANLIAAGRREQKRKLLHNLKSHLSSPLLSDIMDELGFSNNIILGLQVNLDNSKLLGYAKTLKIRAIKDGESPEGIYDALKSYETIVPGDIIVVENEIKDYAYFGELNANLAIRAGAAGALIGGATRDSDAVKGLGFTVFAERNVCIDVKNRAVLDSMNQKINFYGVDVRPNDLIFADHEGVVVLPANNINQILSEVYKAISTENNVLIDIAKGISSDELFNIHGGF